MNRWLRCVVSVFFIVLFSIAALQSIVKGDAAIFTISICFIWLLWGNTDIFVRGDNDDV